MTGVLISGKALLLEAEELVGESHRLRDLEEKVQGANYAAQYGEYRVAGGELILDYDIEVNGEGGILDCW